MKKRYRIVLISILIIFLAAIRFYETRLFYDPLINFFKSSDYLRDKIPDFKAGLLILNTFFRYILNSSISIAILGIAFSDRNIVKFSALLYAFLLLLAGSVFIYLILTIENEHFLALFYVRRFLIHPIFILVLLPAFYYYRMIFLVADADIPLHVVHCVRMAVDPVPALKACGFEVALHLLLFAGLCVLAGLGLVGVQQLLGSHRVRVQAGGS